MRGVAGVEQAVGMNTTSNASKHIDGFEDTVKDFWVSRPRRPRHGRKLAGVAAGVSNRYGVDPAVVRVAFVVLTVFGGIGLPLYLLGWLLFAEEGDETSGAESLVGRGRSSMSKGFALLLCVVLVPLSGWAFAGSWIDGGAFIGLALVVAGVYLLHRGRGHARRPEPTGFTAGYSSAIGSAEQGAWGAPVIQAPAEWDALGADPQGWRMAGAAEPAPPPPTEPSPPPRRKSKIGFATLGVALAVGGVGAALAVGGEPWFTPTHVVGLVLAVLGAGMVAGSFLGGGRGLLWLAVPLSLLGLAVGTFPTEDFRGGFGNLHATPSSAEQVLPRYDRTAGDIRLDLTELSGTAPVETSLHNGAGSITVLVPRDADVTYTCEASLGNVDCLGREGAGLNTPAIRGVDTGTAGTGGLDITLTARAGAGNVEVLRD